MNAGYSSRPMTNKLRLGITGSANIRLIYVCVGSLCSLTDYCFVPIMFREQRIIGNYENIFDTCWPLSLQRKLLNVAGHPRQIVATLNKVRISFTSFSVHDLSWPIANFEGRYMYPPASTPGGALFTINQVFSGSTSKHFLVQYQSPFNLSTSTLPRFHKCYIQNLTDISLAASEKSF